MLLAVIAGCAFGAFYFITTHKPPEPVAPAVVLPKVRILQTQPSLARATVMTRGTVRPRTQSTLSSQVSGVILQVGPAFEVGGTFKKGDMLVEIDATDHYAALTQAEAQKATAQLALQQAQADAATIQQDIAQLGIPANQAGELLLRRPQLAKAQADLRAAEASIALARRNLERTRIDAPYDGRVSRVLVNRGQAVSAIGTPLAEIYANDQAEIEIPLSRVEASGLDFAAKPRARLRDGEAQWVGRLDRSTGMIDERDRMMRAVVIVDNPQAGTTPLQMGQYVNIEIDGRMFSNVFRLPRTALLPGDKTLVVRPDNTLETRQLDIVWREVDSVLARGGLSAGERVCLTRVSFFTEGMQVEVVE